MFVIPVTLPLLRYLKLFQEAYEDYFDVLTFDNAINEPTIAWKEYKKQSIKTE